MRSSKKDFVDLYFLLEKYSLEELLLYAQEKYAQSDYSQTHIIKSLVYFEDAEGQPMPKMHKSMQWEEIKAKIVSEAKLLSLI